MVIAGLILGIFSILGFRHAGKVTPVATSNSLVSPELITASS
jgi:hypothetical protein